MPNWCNNNISITGPNSVIDKIEKIVKEESNNAENGLLQFFNPMPAELKDTTAPAPDKTAKDKKIAKARKLKFGADSWYDWRVNNWGTKWELCEFYGVDRQYHSENNEGESTITFGFDSAWSPPINAYEKFIEDNSDCSLKAWYYEGGCDFMGEWDNGIDDCFAPSDYKSTDDFWQDGVGSTLDDYFGITEHMAEYEAEQEAEKEDVHEYTKGKAMNIGEEV